MKKWPSGRWRQTVNLLVKTLVGSNPAFFNFNIKYYSLEIKNIISGSVQI